MQIVLPGVISGLHTTQSYNTSTTLHTHNNMHLTTLYTNLSPSYLHLSLSYTLISPHYLLPMQESNAATLCNVLIGLSCAAHIKWQKEQHGKFTVDSIPIPICLKQCLGCTISISTNLHTHTHLAVTVCS